jgi:hypothetical protein
MAVQRPVVAPRYVLRYVRGVQVSGVLMNLFFALVNGGITALHLVHGRAGLAALHAFFAVCHLILARKEAGKSEAV